MANVSLNVENLLDVAKRMEEASNKIDNALKRIDNIMNDIDNVWSDKNSKMYLARYAELKQEFPAFKGAVRSYSDFLNAVVDTYRKEFIEPTSVSVK